MWQGFDPEQMRQLAAIKKLSAPRSETPTGEWPLIFLGKYDAVLVVRQWPDGEITAYLKSRESNS